MKSLALFLIKLYRKYISPLFGRCCRYEPSCSQYAEQAYKKYGFFKGSWKTLKRLLRCNPWSKGGKDPLD